MRVRGAVLACVIGATVAVSAQTASQYVLATQVSTIVASGALQVLASPTLMLEAGRQGVLSLGRGSNELNVTLVPTDLGGGRTALRVTVSRERTSVTTFDLLVSPNASSPTVVLRDAEGAFITGPSGLPLLLKVDVSTRGR